MQVQLTPLPGIGTREDFMTHRGRRIGVISHRDGSTELIVSGQEDPDSCAASIKLNVEESGALANLLGAPELVSQLDRQQADVTGVSTAQLPLPPDSPFASSPLGGTQLRTRTGASIVAIARQGTVYPSPRPDFRLHAGDMLIIVGTQDGLRSSAELLERG